MFAPMLGCRAGVTIGASRSRSTLTSSVGAWAAAHAVPHASAAVAARIGVGSNLVYMTFSFTVILAGMEHIIAA